MPPKKTIKKANPTTKKVAKSPTVKKVIRKTKAAVDITPKKVEFEDMNIDAEPELSNFDFNKTTQSKKAEKKKGGKANKLPISMYKKIAYTFFFLTVIMLFAVFYFSFAKVLITIVPNEERVSNSMVLDIYDQEIAESMEAGKGIIGLVEKVELAIDKTIGATGERIISEEIVGEVVVINNATYSQPLVATTRLLSSDGKLFRTKETIQVPAGGKVKVAVYPDKMNSDMAIGPSKFSIPGLSAVKQDKIYAESYEAFQHKKQIQKIVKQSDIDNALSDMKKSLVRQAERQFKEGYKGYDAIMYSIDDDSLDYEADRSVGDEVSDLSVKLKGDVVVIAFNKNDVAAIAEAKLISSTPSNRSLSGFNAGAIGQTLNGVYFDQKKASIKISFEGKMSLSDDSNIINKQAIVGLNKDQLNDYLEGINEISSYEFIFMPNFITKVPRLIDRIEVNIKSE